MWIHSSGLDQKVYEATIPCHSLKGNEWGFRAEPRDAAPTLYHLMPFSLQGNWSLSLPPRMTNCPYLPGLRGFLKHRTFDAKTRTVFFTTQRVGVHRGLPLGPWLLHA